MSIDLQINQLIEDITVNNTDVLAKDVFTPGTGITKKVTIQNLSTKVISNITALPNDTTTNTQATGDNSTKVSTTEFVKNVVATLNNNFAGLSDVTAPYSNAGALTVVNGTKDGMTELTTLVSEPAADQYQISRGAADLLIKSNCTIDQDLQQNATPNFKQLKIRDLPTNNTEWIFNEEVSGKFRLGRQTITPHSVNITFSIDPITYQPSFTFLNTVNGIIVSADASGALISTNDLPDGTTATTQVNTDSTTKLATTEYVHNHIPPASDYWSRVTTGANSPFVQPKNANDNINMNGGALFDSSLGIMTPINLADGSNLAFLTTNKTIVGSLNELFNTHSNLWQRSATEGILFPLNQDDTVSVHEFNVGSAISQGHWLLNGNANDNSDNSYNGTSTNITWVAGKLNQAAQFNGTSSYITMGDVLAFERTDPFSLEAWVKTTQTTGLAMYIIAKRDDPPNPDRRGYSIAFQPTTNLFVVLLAHDDTVNNEIDKRFTDSIGITDGQWHHLILTYDGSSTAAGVNLYVDNTALAISSTVDNLSDTIVYTSPFLIGARGEIGSLGNYWNGEIDEVVVYDFVLSSTQRTERWNSGNGTEDLPSGQTINMIDLDVNLNANSNDRIVTQRAIKSYVDNHEGISKWNEISGVLSPKTTGASIKIDSFIEIERSANGLDSFIHFSNSNVGIDVATGIEGNSYEWVISNINTTNQIVGIASLAPTNSLVIDQGGRVGFGYSGVFLADEKAIFYDPLGAKKLLTLKNSGLLLTEQLALGVTSLSSTSLIAQFHQNGDCALQFTNDITGSGATKGLTIGVANINGNGILQSEKDLDIYVSNLRLKIDAVTGNIRIYENCQIDNSLTVNGHFDMIGTNKEFTLTDQNGNEKSIALRIEETIIYGDNGNSQPGSTITLDKVAGLNQGLLIRNGGFSGESLLQIDNEGNQSLKYGSHWGINVFEDYLSGDPALYTLTSNHSSFGIRMIEGIPTTLEWYLTPQNQLNYVAADRYLTLNTIHPTTPDFAYKRFKYTRAILQPTTRRDVEIENNEEWNFGIPRVRGHIYMDDTANDTIACGQIKDSTLTYMYGDTTYFNFTTAANKDTASKINIYYESNVLKLKNKTGIQINVSFIIIAFSDNE